MASPTQKKMNPSHSAAADTVRHAVEAADDVDARTRQFVNSAEKHINALVRDSGSKYEEISDYLVEKVFGGDTLSALTPSRSAPAAFIELLRRCDDTLDLARPKILQATRIGALNRHLAGSPWQGLGWSIKQELLPLVGADGDLSALKEGARIAAKGIGVRAMREWVAGKATGSERPDDPAQQSAPTIASSRKAFDIAARFARAPDRRRWLDRAEKLPEEERDALLVSLRSASRHLAKLLADFESALQEA